MKISHLLATTAVSVVLAAAAPSFAQTGSGTAAGQSGPAMQGQTQGQGEAQSPHINQIESLINEARQALASDDFEQARDKLSQADMALNRAASSGSAAQTRSLNETGTRIRETQQAIDVNDREGAERSLQQAQSELRKSQSSDSSAANSASSSEQARTQIMVNPQQPQVTVQQPEPQVTVTQPDPNVTVTQPDPKVTVTQPEPEVTVRQREPEVTVRQPEPEVTVQQPEPQVTVQQPEPQVTVQQPEPQVSVQQPEPEVTVRQAEPQVTVQQPDPEVTVRQSDPEVTVRDQVQVDPQIQSSPSPLTDQTTAADAAPDRNEMIANLETRSSEIIGESVYNLNNEDVGEIQDILVDRTANQAYFIVEVGGFLGLGGKRVAIPADQIDIMSGQAMLQSAQTEDDLETMAAFDEGQQEWESISVMR